jgi:hypothetical protein
VKELVIGKQYEVIKLLSDGRAKRTFNATFISMKDDEADPTKLVYLFKLSDGNDIVMRSQPHYSSGTYSTTYLIIDSPEIHTVYAIEPSSLLVDIVTDDGETVRLKHLGPFNCNGVHLYIEDEDEDDAGVILNLDEAIRLRDGLNKYIDMRTVQNR